MESSIDKIEAAMKEEKMAANAQASAQKEWSEARAASSEARKAFQNAPASDKERLCKEWARAMKRVEDTQQAWFATSRAKDAAEKKRQALVMACD